MISKHTSFRSSQSGFTLLEMLLAVGIIGVVLVGISRILTELTEQRLAQTAGQQIGRISTIAEDVAMKRWQMIYGNDTKTVSNADPSATDLPGDILAMLQNNSFPINDSNFRVANSPVEVLIGNEATAGSDTLITRIVVVLENPMPLARATKIARAIGGRGGVIRSDYPGEIRGAFGNWSYAPKDQMLSFLSGVMNPAPGYAYVAAHIAYSEYDRNGPYLSRYESALGQNVMQQDILMNGFSVVGAKDIDVGTLTATRAASFEQLAVNGNAHFNGGLDVANKMNITGDLAVDEGNLTVSSGDLQVPGGDITARGLRADILEADDLTTKDLYTETLNVEGGDTFIASNVTISGGATLDITGTLKASVVDADEINTSTLMTDGLSVDGTTSLNGATTINNTVSIDQLILDGCMYMDGKQYGICN